MTPRGRILPDWQPATTPAHRPVTGRTVELIPLDANAHTADLRDALRDEGLWTYMGYGPFESAKAFDEWVRWACSQEATLFWAVCPRSADGTTPAATTPAATTPAATTPSRAAGVAAVLRVDEAHGRAEVGHICLGPALQRTTAATEALFLLIDQVFAAGFRRCEWKCDALNAASRRSALRLGFRFEGLFADDRVVKGRNRDTARYAITAARWAELRPGFLRWLAADNFEAREQKSRLCDVLALPRPPTAPTGVVLETHRLTLKIPHPDEAAQVAKFYADNHDFLAPWDPVRPAEFTTTSHQRTCIEAAHEQWLTDKALRLLVYRKNDPTPVGAVNFTNIVRGSLQQCYLGYLLGAEAQGNGYMTEALQAAIPWVFEHVGVHRITAEYMPRNSRSAAVLARLGFATEGRKASYLKIAGRWEDHICCALVNPREL